MPNPIPQECFIFNKVNKLSHFSFSQSELISRSGLTRSFISRFIRGETNSNFSNVIQLVGSLPQEFQKRFWRELLSPNIFDDAPRNWEMDIEQASAQELLRILQAAPKRLDELIETGDVINKDNKIYKNNVTKEELYA